MTFIGALLLIPIELLDNLRQLLIAPGLLIGGIKGHNRVNKLFTNLKIKITGLNAYQQDSIEQQRKVYGLLFENLPFTLLLVIISLGGLDCPVLVEGKNAITLIISLCTTLLNVIIAVLMTYIESKWL